jgi:hypothetical protein
MPSLELIKNLVSQRIRVIIVDSALPRKIKPSVMSEHPGYEEIEEMKLFQQQNILFYMVVVDNYSWNWQLPGTNVDVRESELPILYADYQKTPRLPEEITDELFVMYQVQDYKHVNRAYARAPSYESLYGLLNGATATAFIDWNTPVDSVVHRRLYVLQVKCIMYYLENGFEKPIKILPIGRLATNLISTPDPLSYPLQLDHPIMDAMVKLYWIMPEPPRGHTNMREGWEEDKHAYVSSGMDPLRLMCESSQYRQVYTQSLQLVMYHILKKIGVMRSGEDINNQDIWHEALRTLTNQ